MRKFKHPVTIETLNKFKADVKKLSRRIKYQASLSAPFTVRNTQNRFSELFFGCSFQDAKVRAAGLQTESFSFFDLVTPMDCVAVYGGEIDVSTYSEAIESIKSEIEGRETESSRPLTKAEWFALVNKHLVDHRQTFADDEPLVGSSMFTVVAKGGFKSYCQGDHIFVLDDNGVERAYTVTTRHTPLYQEEAVLEIEAGFIVSTDGGRFKVGF